MFKHHTLPSLSFKWLYRLAGAALFVSTLSAVSAQAIRLEAEDGSLTGVSATTEATGYSGTGYVTGFDAADDRVSWSFQADAGLYRATIGFRTPNGEKGFSGAINGSGISGMFDDTNAFATFDLGLVNLQDGTNTAWIGGNWNYYEIDYLEFTPAEAPAGPQAVDPTPVDPDASAEVRELLAYFASVYGQNTLSGQQTRTDAASIQSRVGVYPAILAEDLIEYSPSRIEHGSDPSGLTESLIPLVDNGTILTLCWHWNAPTDLLDTTEQPWWRGFYTEATTFNFAEALADPQGEDYALMLRDIDAIAAQLQKLEDANIPVLWRPLHESEGGWFWWGAQGPDAFKELWQLLYDRLVNYHGLHNLIWVLTSEDPDWYPGDAYVDIVGVDAYPEDMTATLSSSWQAMLDRFDGRKMIALTEFGGIPDIEPMQALGVWWLYFQSWTGGQYGPDAVDDAYLAGVYQSDAVIVRSELPAGVSKDTWAGYAIDANLWVDTGDFLGNIWVGDDSDWIWDAPLQHWIWLPESQVQNDGAWAWVAGD